MASMLILLSPAKSLDFETPAPVRSGDVPLFLAEQTAQLADVMRRKKPADLKKLMEISDRLAQLNVDRFQRFEPELIHARAAGKKIDEAGALPVKQALWAFTGDVYQGLDAMSMSAPERKRAQSRIRMLSGLYGILKPNDYMLPYRLEMGTKLKTKRGKNLYEFWGDAITEALAAEKPTWICNLASKEYYGAVREKQLPCPVVHPVFKDEVKGQFRSLGMFAKYARGLMARWIVDEKIDRAADLSGFDRGGYRHDPDDSSEGAPVFLRSAKDR